jgi:glucose-1-phosphate cytidylyltransferase
MKVVLFCGGLGTRLREYSDTIPKPMVNVGARPIMWHLMKYYAHYGHTEFILCLGYRGDVIRDYFLKYDECLSNDFVLSRGGTEIELYGKDIADWRITFADTGHHANIGQRLKAVEKYLDRDEMFLANYSDGLSDLSLPEYLDAVRRQGKIANLVSVRPYHVFHALSTDATGLVTGIQYISQTDIRLNGGFFAFRRELFDYLKDGEELVEEPFRRLIEREELFAYRHDGFWACMDTFKDKQTFDQMECSGNTPWKVWQGTPATGRRRS